MIDKRLIRVRGKLQAMDGAPPEELAQAWREMYQQMLGYTLHGMHDIAHSMGLGKETGEDWLQVFDVTEPPLPEYYAGTNEAIPILGLTCSRYCRGYELGIKIYQEEAGAWSYRGEWRNPSFATHETGTGTDFNSMDEAFRAGMTACKLELDQLVAVVVANEGHG